MRTKVTTSLLFALSLSGVCFPTLCRAGSEAKAIAEKPSPFESVSPAAAPTDPLKAAIWTHGTIVEPEETPDSTSRKGWGISFTGRPGTSNWFHIPVATPVILDDLRPPLVKVFVFYKTGASRITNIHVYDG